MDDEWSENSRIIGVDGIDFDGEVCIDFKGECEYTYINKKDAIKIAKIFDLKEEDLS